MALFPTEDVLPQEEATRRRAMTQEVGTRRLVIGFLVIIAVWFVLSRIWDLYLLRQTWPPLTAEENGLTVVSTLDRRGAYDRNLFRIVQSEGEARAELTHFGWAAIFSGQHGPLTSERVGNVIQGAISQDSEAGYAMLTPLLAAEVQYEMGDKQAYNRVSADYAIDTALPMTPEEKTRKRIPSRRKTLGELITYFGTDARGRNVDRGETSEGGTGSEHEVEHGLTIPGDVLVKTCPIVLVSRHFAHGWVEEHPVDVLGGRTYSVWLDLTPEGRSRFYQWSRTHVNEHLLLVLKGRVVANGRIAMTMDVDKWEITNLKDAAAAHTLVDFINSRSGQRK